MKALIVLLLLASISGAFAQKEITMCHSGPTEKFALLASNDWFKAAHPDPEPYFHTAASGKNITFKTTDGKDAYGYFLKAKSPSKKFLFVFHEWYGLNDYIKKESEKLYNDLGNVNVFAIDLYDKNVASNSDEARKMMQEMQKSRGEAIVLGAVDYAGDNAEIATIGWCFGGGWSMQAALLLGERAQGCVIYYGMPEMDDKKLKSLDCEVLGIFASEDRIIKPELVKEFAEKMDQTGNDLEYKIFNGVHGFANPSNPRYDSQATSEAYDLTIKFLKREL